MKKKKPFDIINCPECRTVQKKKSGFSYHSCMHCRRVIIFNTEKNEGRNLNSN